MSILIVTIRKISLLPLTASPKIVEQPSLIFPALAHLQVLFIFALLGCVVNAILGLDLTLSQNSALAQRIIGAVIAVSMVVTLVTLCTFSNDLIYHLSLARGIHIDDFDDFDDVDDFDIFNDSEEEREDPPPPPSSEVAVATVVARTCNGVTWIGRRNGCTCGTCRTCGVRRRSLRRRRPCRRRPAPELATWTEEEIQAYADITAFEIAQRQLREDAGKANVLDRLAAKGH